MNDGNDGSLSLEEAVAMRLFPDHHTFPLKLYVKDDSKTFSALGWKTIYAEMMSKPTDMPREQWHAKFVERRNNKEGEPNGRSIV